MHTHVIEKASKLTTVVKKYLIHIHIHILETIISSVSEK